MSVAQVVKVAVVAAVVVGVGYAGYKTYEKGVNSLIDSIAAYKKENQRVTANIEVLVRRLKYNLTDAEKALIINADAVAKKNADTLPTRARLHDELIASLRALGNLRDDIINSVEPEVLAKDAPQAAPKAA